MENAVILLSCLLGALGSSFNATKLFESQVPSPSTAITTIVMLAITNSPTTMQQQFIHTVIHASTRHLSTLTERVKGQFCRLPLKSDILIYMVL